MSDTFKMEGPKADRMPRRKEQGGDRSLLLDYYAHLMGEAQFEADEARLLEEEIDAAHDEALDEEWSLYERSLIERGICPVCMDTHEWCPDWTPSGYRVVA